MDQLIARGYGSGRGEEAVLKPFVHAVNRAQYFRGYRAQAGDQRRIQRIGNVNIAARFCLAKQIGTGDGGKRAFKLVPFKRSAHGGSA